mmetsp:Transcript_8035/g.16924  ORF Transcript_8035/g.16924 Transcript_8035/m.16924 type:complete len:212 (-) Transcript_8035:37-672(-)
MGRISSLLFLLLLLLLLALLLLRRRRGPFGGSVSGFSMITSQLPNEQLSGVGISGVNAQYGLQFIAGIIGMSTQGNVRRCQTQMPLGPIRMELDARLGVVDGGAGHGQILGWAAIVVVVVVVDQLQTTRHHVGPQYGLIGLGWAFVLGLQSGTIGFQGPTVIASFVGPFSVLFPFQPVAEFFVRRARRCLVVVVAVVVVVLRKVAPHVCLK